MEERMRTEMTRPGILPHVLLHAHGWQTDEVRRVSFDMPEWKAILISDETGPIGAACFTEPSIYDTLVVDTIVLHPDRPGTEGVVLSVCLPVLTKYAVRFKAKRIVFEAVGPKLRAALAAYDAREDSATLSVGVGGFVEPVFKDPEIETPLAAAFSCECGKSYPKQNYLTNHQKACKNRGA
jgi:hypothetical protein